MPREARGSTFKLKTKGPDGRALWAFRVGSGKARVQRGGFRTEGEAKAALATELDRRRAARTSTLAASMRDLTVEDVARLYLEAHTASARTVDNYRAWLAAATRPVAEGGLGDMPVRSLSPLDVATWRARQPERSAHYYHKALSQALAWAVTVARVVPENVAAAVPNPRAKKREIAYFETWAEVEALDAELPAFIRGIGVFGAGTGLMPEEWIALQWSDVDLDAGVVTVRRAYSEGRLTDYGKTEGRRRRVPLRRRVLDALDARPRGIRRDALVFPGRDGEFLPLRSFRRNDWNPAVEAAGFDERRTTYALRHTYAAFSLAAGVNIYTLARRMGTSVAMIDRTYGHLAPDAEEFERGLLDAFDARTTTEAADEAAGREQT